jgi:D-3-phosphoglycerate dehydrogenase
LVDRAALEAALKDKRIAGAAFDVFWGEPADPADSLLALTNFVLTPHVAGFSDNSIAHIAEEVVANIHRLCRDEPLAFVANR